MSSTVETIRRVGGDWQDVRVRQYAGRVGDVAPAVTEKIAAFGHKVEAAGGDWTGEDGAPKQMHYLVTVRLDGRDWVWQHSFLEPVAADVPTSPAPVSHPETADDDATGGGQ